MKTAIVELDVDGRGSHGQSKFVMVDGWLLGVGWMLAMTRRRQLSREKGT
jgi:hypothetical protein